MRLLSPTSLLTTLIIIINSSRQKYCCRHIQAKANINYFWVEQFVIMIKYRTSDDIAKYERAVEVFSVYIIQKLNSSRVKRGKKRTVSKHCWSGMVDWYKVLNICFTRVVVAQYYQCWLNRGLSASVDGCQLIQHIAITRTATYSFKPQTFSCGSYSLLTIHIFELHFSS